MIATREFLLRAQLDAETLEAWIAAGWLLPRGDDEEARFAEIDIARARLIRDLQAEIGVNDEGVGVTLDLLDQIHGLRRLMRDLLAATRPAGVDPGRPGSPRSGRRAS